MASSQEKLLKEFEKFQVQQILDEVKKWTVDDEDIREFGEELLEERRKRREAAKAAQTARHIFVRDRWTQAVTHNSTPSGTSGASTSAGPTGTTNSRGPRHLRQPHRRPRPSSVESCCRCSRRGPTSSLQTDSDSHDDDEDNDDEDNDDDDDIDCDINNKVTAVLVKEARRLALKRACRARYRARHPERVAEQRRRYYAKNRDRVVEYKRQYRAKNRDRLLEQSRQYKKRRDAQRAEFMRRYYADHAERLREQKRQFYRSEAGQRWQKQYLARKRESAALLRRQRGPMVQKRTEEKRQALGPLKLTVTLEDFMADFCNALSPSPEDSMDQPEVITDMDSGVLDPLDHSVCDESSLSSCDMWDDRKGFLDNLLEEFNDLPSSSSDNSLFDFLTDMMQEDLSFDFLTDMMQEDPSFDLDDFVI